MAQKDYYSILNIDHKASIKTIKSAYRQMALKYHPDHNPDNPEALEQFNLVREAYEKLTEPNFKKNYDSSYRPQTPTDVKREPSTKTHKGPSKHLRYNLYVTLEDINKGCSRTIRYIRKNKKEKETIQVTVKVPKGAFHHQRLKLKDFGDTDDQGRGDLFVIVHLQNHPVFLKKGLNLRINIPISYLDAALGSEVIVPTLNGFKTVKLKACDFEGIQFKINGAGLPEHKGEARGDLYAYFFIEHPKKLNPSEKSHFQKCLKTWPEGQMMQQYQSYLNQRKADSK